MVSTVRRQWIDAGRSGTPRLVFQVDVAVGSAATIEAATSAIAEYYAFTGRPGWGTPITDVQEIADLISAYREFGADELVLYCYGDDPDQIETLAALIR